MVNFLPEKVPGGVENSISGKQGFIAFKKRPISPRRWIIAVGKKIITG
jgi:hypothetical protein